jgi:hypothetical protein
MASPVTASPGATELPVTGSSAAGDVDSAVDGEAAADAEAEAEAEAGADAEADADADGDGMWL